MTKKDMEIAALRKQLKAAQAAMASDEADYPRVGEYKGKPILFLGPGAAIGPRKARLALAALPLLRRFVKANPE